ncbi:MAG TPA: DUF4303 domain-containing protein [Tepidisphaeraceae bacterium]|nr:DUF4303 domain-containing protein [Tepidisphaeraceae bacterium]
MAKPRATKLTPAALRDAYAADLRAAWEYFRTKYGDQTPYAFVMYGVEDPTRLEPHVLTEEGLTRVAQRYLKDGYHDTLDEARKALRYSVADSPLFDALEGRVPAAEALLAGNDAALDRAGGYVLLVKTAADALARLDKEGLFGKGKARAGLLLAVLLEDADDDEGLADKATKRLNPPAVVKRFEKETAVEGVYAAADVIALAPGGKTIYVAGTRDDQDGEDSDENHVARVDLAGRKLTRRWAFAHPNDGDSVAALVAHPAGRAVYALRTQVGDDGESAGLLMRFAHDRGKPTHERRLNAQGTALAVSPDGSRLALALADKTVALLDPADLRTLATHKIPDTASALLWLANGPILAATGKLLVRLDPDGGKVTATVKLPAFHLAADAGERLLAVGRWFEMRDILDRSKRKPFGVTLLRLPSLKPVREVRVDGFQAVTPALSPDGTLLACELHRIGVAPRYAVAVFDTRTGKELARRKSNYVNDLAFLPDGRTLVIADSGHYKGEALTLWKIPGRD